MVFVQDIFAPEHVDRIPYLIKLAGGDKNPLDDWIVPMIFGTLLGGFASGWLDGRLKVETNKGPNITVRTRWLMAFIGGLIMGVGFIVGGFCPGTSLVAMATRKLDGLFLVLGVLFGIFLFGETERFYDVWWNTAGYMGRVTIPEWLNLPVGVVVVGVVLMALFMFWGAEQLEHIFGGRDLKKEPRWRRYLAVGLVTFAVSIIVIGMPTTEDKYARVAATKNAALANREVQIHPGDLLTRPPTTR